MPISGYILHGFESKKVRPIVNEAVRKLRKYQYDAIAVRGVSGMLIGPIVAMLAGKSLIVVRKQENSHSCSKVESPLHEGTYIVLDDFISSGATVKAIIEEIKMAHPKMVMLGMYSWSSSYSKATLSTHGWKDLRA